MGVNLTFPLLSLSHFSLLHFSLSLFPLSLPLPLFFRTLYFPLSHLSFPLSFSNSMLSSPSLPTFPLPPSLFFPSPSTSAFPSLCFHLTLFLTPFSPSPSFSLPLSLSNPILSSHSLPHFFRSLSLPCSQFSSSLFLNGCCFAN